MRKELLGSVSLIGNYLARFLLDEPHVLPSETVFLRKVRTGVHSRRGLREDPFASSQESWVVAQRPRWSGH